MQHASAFRLLDDGLLTVREAAALARQCVSSVYAAMERGDLAYVKLGRSRRVPRRALLEYMAANLKGGWATSNNDAEPQTSADQK